MVLGIFWKRATREGAVCAMVAGLGMTVFYMVWNQPGLRRALALAPDGLWFGIQPVSSGVFGVAAGLSVAILVSLWTRVQGAKSV
jgi:cation/acetate symporter